ncbi:MAG TPA: hypothetical protein VH684_04855 [Xanthobacteraceae bacterium]|jgi:hypothetical protein
MSFLVRLPAHLYSRNAFDAFAATGFGIGTARAMAALCAAPAGKDLGASVQGVYTFGMPRTGTPDFARAYDALLGERTYRLVYGEDIVPTVPPSESGFAHVGHFLKCARGSKFDAVLLTQDFPDDPQFLDTQLDGLRAGLLDIVSGNLPAALRPDLLGRAFSLLPPGIGDHLPDRYWAAL